MIERKSPNVPCGMDYMEDDRLAAGDSEMDIVATVNGET
jgi:hypothetical protein